MKWKESFHPYAIITIVFWSLAYVLTRLALRYFSAFPLGFLRYFIASCAFLILALFTRMKLPEKVHIKWFLASGASGFFLYMLAFNKGCETVSAATSSTVIATVPVITAVLARFIYHEKLSPLQWVAVGVEFSGVITLTLMKGALTLNHGLLWLFFAAILLSTYNLLQRKLTKFYSGIHTTAYSIFAGTIMLSLFLPDSIREVREAPPIQLIYLVLLGVFSSAVAYAAWAQAFKKAEKASSVSNYMFITPLLTSLLGFLLANERPDIPTLTGGTIILIGMLLFNIRKKPSKGIL